MTGEANPIKDFNYPTIFCNKCDYSCRKERQIKLHQATKHEGFRFRCTHCQKEFQYSNAMKQHIMAEHEGVRYKCDQCDHTTKKKGDLQHHKSVHEKVRKKFPCRNCTKKYSHKKALMEHIKTYHERDGMKIKLLPCHQCHESFPTKMKLALHVGATHFSVDEKYPCHLCGLETYSKRILKNHVIDHINKNKHYVSIEQ